MPGLVETSHTWSCCRKTLTMISSVPYQQRRTLQGHDDRLMTMLLYMALAFSQTISKLFGACHSFVESFCCSASQTSPRTNWREWTIQPPFAVCFLGGVLWFDEKQTNETRPEQAGLYLLVAINSSVVDHLHLRKSSFVEAETSRKRLANILINKDDKGVSLAQAWRTEWSC